MCQSACSDTLPRFRATSCLRECATPCLLGYDLLPPCGSRPPAFKSWGHPALWAHCLTRNLTLHSSTNTASRIIVAFSTLSPLHQFPFAQKTGSPYNASQGVRFLVRQSGGSICHFGRGVSHRTCVREASMREGVSLQNRRELLQHMLPQYREVSSVKKKSKLLDAFTATTGHHCRYTM